MIEKLYLTSSRFTMGVIQWTAPLDVPFIPLVLGIKGLSVGSLLPLTYERGIFLSSIPPLSVMPLESPTLNPYTFRYSFTTFAKESFIGNPRVVWEEIRGKATFSFNTHHTPKETPLFLLCFYENTCCILYGYQLSDKKWELIPPSLYYYRIPIKR